jgi:hypothetical protein
MECREGGIQEPPEKKVQVSASRINVVNVLAFHAKEWTAALLKISPPAKGIIEVPA